MTQQTAVEWLIEQLEGDDSKVARVIGLKKYNSIVEQAKQMEKEQMIDFTNEWFTEYCEGVGYFKTPEQYYNKTYKQ